jgi:predicted nucleic acid-binding protein
VSTTLVVDASVWVSAADRTDPFSVHSRAFLTAVAEDARAIALHAYAPVEIACALGRRLRNADRAKALTIGLLQSPLIEAHPISPSLLEKTVEIGTRDFLGAGDALYSALSEMVGGETISWDDDLVLRSGALTPVEWLERRGGGQIPPADSAAEAEKQI